jgi:shikimate dehydrogenase
MKFASIVTGKTGVYGIIGFPVAHSLSPVMQNSALQASGICGIYVPFTVAPEQLAAAVAGLRALQVCGFNVTIPHKSAIMPLLDGVAPSAVQAGAVNTVVNQEGRLIGHNTDGDGLVRSLEHDLDCRIGGARVVMLGAGGAARGALAAFCRAGAKSVTVVNRTRTTADSLIAAFADAFPDTALQASDFGPLLTTVLPQADLVINATSLGMAGEKIEGLALALLSDHAKVYDMVYNPPQTPLLHDACSQGVQSANGLGMLIAQGELAFSLWHGRDPVAGVMMQALESFFLLPAKA